MSDPDLATAQQFQSAAEDAIRTGDFAPVGAVVATDVECVTPARVSRGVDALTDELSRGRPAETLAVEFEDGDWQRVGDGRYSWQTHLVFRSKATGEVSYTRDRSFELTIRDGQVSRCEMRFAD